MSEIIHAVGELSRLLEEASTEELDEAIKIVSAAVNELDKAIRYAVSEKGVANLNGGIQVELALRERQHVYRNVEVALRILRSNRSWRE